MTKQKAMTTTRNAKQGFKRLKGAVAGFAMGAGMLGGGAAIASTTSRTKGFALGSQSQFSLRWFANYSTDTTVVFLYKCDFSETGNSYAIFTETDSSLSSAYFQEQETHDFLACAILFTNTHFPIIPGIDFGVSRSTNSYSETPFVRDLSFTVNDQDFMHSKGSISFEEANESLAATLTATRRNIIDGVDSRLEYFVSGDQPLARVLATLTNTTDASIALDLDYGFELGSNPKAISTTSSGDQNIDDDEWVLFEVGTQNSRFGGLVLVSGFGEGAEVQPTTTFISESGSYDQSYSLTIPANSSQSVLMYLAVSPDTAEAENSRDNIEADPELLLEGLSPEQRAQVVNYKLIPDEVMEPETETETETEEPAASDGGSTSGSTTPALLLGLGGLLAIRKRKVAIK